MLDNFENIKEDFNEEEAAFLNDSWAKMASMLEDEMPAGPAPIHQPNVSVRRYLALLLLLILAGGGLWLGTKETISHSDGSNGSVEKTIHNTMHPNALAKADVNSTSEETTNEKAIEKVPEQAKSPIQENIESKNITVKKKKTKVETIPQKTSIQNTASNNNTTQSVKSSETPSKTIPVKVGSPETSENSDVINSVSELKGIRIPTVSTAIAKTTLSASSAKLALNTTQELISTEASFQANSLVIPTKKTKKWNYGVMAGVQQEKINQGFGGVSVGFLLNRKMAKNFTVETGLNYSLTQFNQAMLNNSPTAVAFEQPGQNISSGIEEELTVTFLPSDANQGDAIQFGSASWLSIPFLLTYQPGRTWRVNMGVEYSQLLQANEQKIINNTSGSSGRITDLIAENNISALTGLTWFPHKNLGIDIRYIFGFTDLSKANPKFIEQTDTRAALQWSLVYYFNPNN